jgi:hypothetical protein
MLAKLLHLIKYLIFGPTKVPTGQEVLEDKVIKKEDELKRKENEKLTDSDILHDLNNK